MQKWKKSSYILIFVHVCDINKPLLIEIYSFIYSVIYVLLISIRIGK